MKTSHEPIRVGVVQTHPIQYYSPIFRALAHHPGIDLTVLYGHRPSAEEQGAGFGVVFQWDQDLLFGYKSEWLNNTAAHPNLETFNGVADSELAARIRRHEFDIVWVQGWNRRLFWQAIFACFRSRIPIIVRSDSHLHTRRSGWKSRLKDWLYPFFIRRFSGCMAVGQWSEDYFRHYGARQIYRTPHCVDNDFFAARAEVERKRRRFHREQWGIPPDAVVFLYAAKFHDWKRALDLIRAIELTAGPGTVELTAGPETVGLQRPIWGLMVGDGDCRKECEEYAAGRYIPVSFAGFLNQSQMPAAYAAADCLVLPSDGNETWGLVVNEAMVSGLPAIVSDEVGSGPDMVIEDRTGYRYPRGNIDALAALLKRAAGENRLGWMGEQAAAHASQFTITATARAAATTIESVWQVHCSRK